VKCKKENNLILQIFIFINNINLDAALVVLFWTELICYDLSISPNQNQKLVFFLCTWLGYSADRFLESFGRVHDSIISNRHLFFLGHKKVFVLIWLSILSLSIILSIDSFPFFQILHCIGLLILVIINQLQSFYRLGLIELVFPKNIRTSLILTLTCSYLPFSSLIEISGKLLFLPVILALVFLINCLKIRDWEALLTVSNNGEEKCIEKFKLRNLCSVIITVLIGCLILRLISVFFLFQMGVSIVLICLVCLDKSKIEPDRKCVLLDQVYWIVPSVIFLTI
jgi:hypothetical protein